MPHSQTPSVEVRRLLHENQILQQEWQTCEELLSESQKDNEQKCSTIESQKSYIRELEKLVDETLGSDWKLNRKIVPQLAFTSSTTTNSSTPLPKPSSFLRHSSSVTFSSKRSSKQMRRMSASNTSWNVLEGLKAITEVGDNTPTGALKRLQGVTQERQGPLLSTQPLAPQGVSKIETNELDPTTYASTNCPTKTLGPETTGDHVSQQLTEILFAVRGASPANRTQSRLETELLAMERRCLARQVSLRAMCSNVRPIQATSGT